MPISEPGVGDILADLGGPDWDALVARVLAGEPNAAVAAEAGVGGRDLNMRVQSHRLHLRREAASAGAREGEAGVTHPAEPSPAAAAEEVAPVPEPAAAAPDPDARPDPKRPWTDADRLAAREMQLAGVAPADIARRLRRESNRVLPLLWSWKNGKAKPPAPPSHALVPVRPAGALVAGPRPVAQDAGMQAARLEEMADAERTKAVACSIYPEMHP